MNNTAPPQPKPLSAKQQTFVSHYLTCWNGYKAAIAAGYSEHSARHQASRMLSYDNIQAAIQAQLTEYHMSANEVLSRLTAIARGSLGEDFIRIEREWYHPRMPLADPTEDDPQAVRWVEDPIPRERIIQVVDLDQAKARGKLFLLKKWKDHSVSGIEIELHDPVRALEMLGRHHKLFVDRNEVTGKDGNPIEVSDARTRLLDRLTRRAADADEAGDHGVSE